MDMRKWAACVVCVTLSGPVAIQAQEPAPAKAGSPTPGTPQPEAPNVADRITLSGCVQLADGAPRTPAAAQTSPTDSRFVLMNVKKESRVPTGTGTSPAAAAPAADTYRLEALESQLSAFVGMKVEISGEVKTGAASRPPVLLVEFVQKVAAKCP
jgi:hypothetical protein